MEEVPDDFEAGLEPPTLVREKTVKKGRPKKEAKSQGQMSIKFITKINLFFDVLGIWRV